MPDLRGLFLRGYGEQAHTQNNGTNVGETETVHTSEALGIVQGDAFRETGAKGELTFGIVGNQELRYPAVTGTGVFSEKRIKKALVLFITTWTESSSNKIISFDMANTLPTSNEIRPVNMAVRYLIRALP